MSIKPDEGDARLRIGAVRIYPRIGGTVRITPIEPSPLPKKQAEQLRQLREELPPKLLARWSSALDTIANGLDGRGLQPEDFEACTRYLKEQVAQGRPLDSELIKETAQENLCHIRTAQRAAKKLREAT
jgi:hypothetical protein